VIPIKWNKHDNGFPSLLVILLFVLLVNLTPLAHATGPPLKIGVASMITPVDSVKYYQDVIDYIGEAIGRPVQMVHRRTYAEMDALLEKGEVKVAFICSGPYVRNRKRFGVELLVAPRVHGKSAYHAYIIVHGESPIKSFIELKDKTFAFTDPRSNTGKLYPTYLLTTMGTAPEKFFQNVRYSYSHNKSIEMVAKKMVDGAAVQSPVYDYMLKAGSPYVKQTKIIKRSPPYGNPPVVVTRDIDPVLRNTMKEAFLAMGKKSKGRAILDTMMIDEFVEVPDASYDAIRAMEQAVVDVPMAATRKRDTKTINVGVIPLENPRIMYEHYQPLLDYLAVQTPYTYELLLKKTNEDTVNALGSGEMDVALLGPMTYLEARAKYGVVCLAKPKGANGDARYRSVIIVKKGSAFKQLSELKGRSFAFSASKSTSGNIFPCYLMANAGIHLDDLYRYVNFDYHDSVVKAVLRGQVDAGAVRDSIARKYSRLGIDVLAESNLIPTGPVVAGPGTPIDVIDNIKRALLGLSPEDPSHWKILQKLDECLKNGFTDATDADYNGIRGKLNAVPRTCGVGCHPKIQL
jgi:phosphonate transport system substrate-binding protein